MDINAFQDLLQDLNPKLYVDFKKRMYSLNPDGTSGIYLRGKKREHMKGYTQEAAISNAQEDDYIAWCTHGWVPEGNKYDENGRMVAFGWRSIVRRLIDKGVVDRAKAFRRVGYLNSDYDRMSHEEKLRFECQ
jgi:hypothetical protein